MHEGKCNVPEGEPTAPGSLKVDQHATNEDGTCAMTSGNKVPLTSTDKGKVIHNVELEEAKIANDETACVSNAIIQQGG